MTVLARIKWAELGELVWVAPLAGVGITLAFSFAVLGVARIGDARREGATAQLAGGALLVVAGLGAFFAAVAFGISVIAS